MSDSAPVPELEIQKVLRSNWDPAATVYGKQPTIDTGDYRSSDATVPVISITGGNEGPIQGSPSSGYSAMDGGGAGGIQQISGAVTVDCVAGSYDDLAGAGPNGEDLHPKRLRWEMYSHATQLLVDHQHNTALMSISPGDGDKIETAQEEEDGVTYTFSIQFRARYLYERRPTA